MESKSHAVTFPVWLWPNVLSLDAPVVAALWQLLFARCFRVSLGLPVVLVLMATVWLIYSADRALDAWHGGASASRHQFYHQHWRLLAPIWAVVILIDIWLVCHYLSPTQFQRGAFLLCAVIVYFVLVHAGGRNFRAKEMAVGGLFALGASLIAWSNLKTPADAAAVVLFAVLCWVNCAAIESWETNGRNNMGHLRSITVGAGLAASALLFLHRPLLGGAEAASAGAFLLLWKVRGRLSCNALRVLADVALLTPIFFLPVARSV